MARPTTKRRLRNIDPDDFGREVAERVGTHVTSILPDADEATARIIEQHLDIVTKKASLLAEYAQDGALDPKQASDLLFTVSVWLYSCAGQALSPENEALSPENETNASLSLRSARTRACSLLLEKHDVFPTDDLGIIILAAHARVRLDHNGAVPVRELACLAGVDPDHVRLLARQGEITIDGGVVAPQITKQWLETRGIPIGGVKMSDRPGDSTRPVRGRAT